MAGLDVASGGLSDHDSGVQPLLTGGSGVDPLAGQTQAASIVPDNRFDPGDYGNVFDATASLQAQMAAQVAEVAGPMAAGMAAKHGLNDRYEGQQSALGGRIGDPMVLPVVPAAAVPPAMSNDYPFSGTEPTEAAAGMAGPYPAGP